ncbi:Putative 115 kDa protein in type-1 retrotransposable element R1DM [Eumeta japonica]|uniref:115 kDa protein in type-1 retrotransposable element R1DM n=1 Tax=Eumeta variegata TaxID=151549 RepID=A0A4C1XEQ2_EUMVA|nr:Putative 115 kDa protein in type-1 retrotransposable element R1DM [Eumeta japonica]
MPRSVILYPGLEGGCHKGDLEAGRLCPSEVFLAYRPASCASVYVQAFTDDAILVFSGQLASSIEKETNHARARVHCWGVKNKLRFTPSKTNSIVLTKKLKCNDPVVHMDGEQISLVGEIRLLALTIDNKLTFIPHVAKACEKAANIYKDLARAAKATWSLSQEVIRTIQITVIEPFVLYASCAWHRKQESSACERCSTLSNAASPLRRGGLTARLPAFRADPLKAATSRH